MQCPPASYYVSYKTKASHNFCPEVLDTQFCSFTQNQAVFGSILYKQTIFQFSRLLRNCAAILNPYRMMLQTASPSLLCYYTHKQWSYWRAFSFLQMNRTLHIKLNRHWFSLILLFWHIAILLRMHTIRTLQAKLQVSRVTRNNKYIQAMSSLMWKLINLKKKKDKEK